MGTDNLINLVPAQSAPFSRDDSAVQEAWHLHHNNQRRLLWSNVIMRAAVGLGTLLAGAGVLAWALMPRPLQQTVIQAPPVTVNVPKQDPPNVIVNVPKQDPPNITVNVPKQEFPDMTPNAVQSPPFAQPAPHSQAKTDEGKTVVDFAVFHRTKTGRMTVVTGWNYASVEDKAPRSQWCYIDGGPASNAHIMNTREGRIPEGIQFARQLGYSEAEIDQAINSCQWFQGTNAHIKEKH